MRQYGRQHRHPSRVLAVVKNNSKITQNLMFMIIVVLELLSDGLQIQQNMMLKIELAKLAKLTTKMRPLREKPGLSR